MEKIVTVKREKNTDNEIITQLAKQQYNSSFSFITFEGKSYLVYS